MSIQPRLNRLMGDGKCFDVANWAMLLEPCVYRR